MKLNFSKPSPISIIVLNISKNFYEIGTLEKEPKIFTLKEYEKKNSSFSYDSKYWLQLEKDIEEKKLFCNQIYVVVSSNFGFFHAESLLSIPESEIVSYLERKVNEDYGIKLSSYYYNFSIKPIDKTKILELVVAGIEKRMFGNLTKVLDKVGLEILNISIPQISILNLITGSEIVRNDIAGFLYMDEEIACFFILSDGYLRSYKQLSISQKTIFDSLHRTIYTTNGVVELNKERIENLVKKHGYPFDNGESDSISYEQLRFLLSPPLELLKDEIKFSISNYIKNNPTDKINKIYFIAWASEFKNLNRYLESKLSIKMVPLPFFKYCEDFLIEGKLNIDGNSILPLIGVLNETKLGELLLPDEYKLKKKAKKFRKIWIFITSGIFLFLFLIYIILQSNLVYYHHLIENAQTTLSNFKLNLAKINMIYKKEEKLAKSISKINDIISQQPDWIGIMKELSNITPSKIILDSIEKQKNSFIIMGHTISTSELPDVVVTKYIQTLEGSLYFKNVKLISSKRSISLPLPSFNFEIECIINSQEK
jgi:hypothetical protein